MARIPAHTVEDAPAEARPRATAQHGTLEQQVRTALMLAAAAADGNQYALAIISRLASRSGWQDDRLHLVLPELRRNPSRRTGGRG